MLILLLQMLIEKDELQQEQEGVLIIIIKISSKFSDAIFSLHHFLLFGMEELTFPGADGH